MFSLSLYFLHGEEGLEKVLRLPLHHISLSNFKTMYSIFTREEGNVGLNPFRHNKGLSSCALHPKQAL